VKTSSSWLTKPKIETVFCHVPFSGKIFPSDRPSPRHHTTRKLQTTGIFPETAPSVDAHTRESIAATNTSSLGRLSFSTETCALRDPPAHPSHSLHPSNVQQQ
ncbi:unnamed protein product, partial [Laminaria digitata]